MAEASADVLEVERCHCKQLAELPFVKRKDSLAFCGAQLQLRHCLVLYGRNQTAIYGRSFSSYRTTVNRQQIICESQKNPKNLKANSLTSVSRNLGLKSCALCTRTSRIELYHK